MFQKEPDQQSQKLCGCGNGPCQAHNGRRVPGCMVSVTFQRLPGVSINAHPENDEPGANTSDVQLGSP